jgi:hypothetical protein
VTCRAPTDKLFDAAIAVEGRERDVLGQPLIDRDRSGVALLRRDFIALTVEEGIVLVAGAIGARIARDVEIRPVQLRGAERRQRSEAAIDGVERRAVACRNGEAIEQVVPKVWFARRWKSCREARRRAASVVNPHGL